MSGPAYADCLLLVIRRFSAWSEPCSVGMGASNPRQGRSANGGCGLPAVVVTSLVGFTRLAIVTCRDDSLYRGVPARAATRLVVPAAADQDRAEVFRRRHGPVLVVADGAGGVTGGADAAQRVVDALSAAARSKRKSGFDELLETVDRELAGRGMTTAVVVTIVNNSVVGASVGDSEAWLIRPDACEVLTARQLRKPLVGSGQARAVAFAAEWTEDSTLLLGTDGLFKYTSAVRIVERVRSGGSPAALVDLVRLPPSSALQDDVAIILWRGDKAGTHTA